MTIDNPFPRPHQLINVVLPIDNQRGCTLNFTVLEALKIIMAVVKYERFGNKPVVDDKVTTNTEGDAVRTTMTGKICYYSDLFIDYFHE